MTKNTTVEELSKIIATKLTITSLPAIFLQIGSDEKLVQGSQNVLEERTKLLKKFKAKECRFVVKLKQDIQTRIAQPVPQIYLRRLIRCSRVYCVWKEKVQNMIRLHGQLQ